MTAEGNPLPPEAQPRVTPTGNGNGAPPPPPDLEEKPKRDLVGEFKKLASAEKVVGMAAAAVFLGFIVANLWVDAFGNWFYACALVGSLGALVLIAAELFEIKLLDAKPRGVLLLTFALLPALGFVIETLYNTWTALMLAGACAMAWAAMKIILGEDES